MEEDLKNQPEISLSGKEKVRYALLDEFRGFLVLCMIVYHGLLSVFELTGLVAADLLFKFFTPAEPFFAGAFITLSGMMCGFSRSNIKRGTQCFLLALAVSAVTVIGSNFLGRIDIYFGILHLLGFSMLFCAIFNFALKRVNKWVGCIVAVLLFVISYGVPTDYFDFVGIRNIIPGSWYLKEGLFPFGFTTPDFYSADYFPILPWFFLFLLGYYLYKFHFVERFSNIFIPKRIKPLGFLGRHALLIYVIHQPIIYLICMPFAQ